MNRVVARFVDGRMIKGMTADFLPAKDSFHLSVSTTAGEGAPVEIFTKDLKALFFVKELGGNPQYPEKKAFDPSRPQVGRRIKVVFKDGEILLGTTMGYQPGRPGFFLVPGDPNSNNERCYVVTAATLEVRFL